MSIEHRMLKDLATSLPRPDVFICCGSYELRSRSIPDSLPPDFSQQVLVAENVDLDVYVGNSVQHIINRFGNKARKVEIDSSSPIKTADALTTELNAVRGDAKSPINYLVDITTFTHESLLILFQLLQRTTSPVDSVSFCYCSAAEYSLGLSKNDKWLSKGVQDVRSVLGFPGRILPWRKDHLIILVGYEHERASKLIEVVDPDLISLGHGTRDPKSPKHNDANNHFDMLFKQTVARYPRVIEFSFSCDDPCTTRDILLEQANLEPDYNVIIAPMNTKISTVGCALAALESEEIQLCYAQARVYNYANYSSPGAACYVFDLPGIIPKK